VRDPAPSPDGTRIAFTVAWYPPGVSWTDGDVYVANRDGTGLRRLTSAPGLDDQPAWSPDGRRIAFRRSSGAPGLPVQVDLHVVDAAGGAATRIALPGLEVAPAWSPDGALLAFASNYGSQFFEIYTARPDGTGLTRRTTNNVDDRTPRWNPRR
jgi:TolB protein